MDNIVLNDYKCLLITLLIIYPHKPKLADSVSYLITLRIEFQLTFLRSNDTLLLCHLLNGYLTIAFSHVVPLTV